MIGSNIVGCTLIMKGRKEDRSGGKMRKKT